MRWDQWTCGMEPAVLDALETHMQAGREGGFDDTDLLLRMIDVVGCWAGRQLWRVTTGVLPVYEGVVLTSNLMGQYGASLAVELQRCCDASVESRDSGDHA